MFEKEPDDRKAKFQSKYEDELIAVLEDRVQKVEHKIKAGIIRVDGQGHHMQAQLVQPEMNAYQEANAQEKRDKLEQNIAFFME